jgi:hypothetical protein
MALAAANPIPQFFDTDGSPLGGLLNFGVANLNPITDAITVYWDAAQTQPAAQPIQVKNGMPMRAGTPALIFVAQGYSLLVRDNNGRQVLYAPNSADFGNLSALAAPTGSNAVGHSTLDGGTTTVGAELRRIETVVQEDGTVDVGDNPTTSTLDAVLVHRALVGTTNCHAFRDESTIRNVTDAGLYASFDAKVNVLGSHVHNHIYDFQDRSVYTATGGGKLENQAGLYSEPEFYGGAATVDRRHGVRIKEYIGASGIVTEQIGVIIEPLQKGVQNFGVVVQDGKNIFNGQSLFGANSAVPANNEGVSWFGTRLNGASQSAFQATGVGLNAINYWAGFQATPTIDVASGNVGNLVGFRAMDAIGSAVPVVVNQAGLVVEDLLRGTNRFGVVLNLTVGANKWNLYAAGSAQNYVAGKLALGNGGSAPTAKLEIGAQTTAANSAPIKLIAGTLMTTPENGAIEFDGTHIYCTIGGVRKQLDN